MRFVLDPEETSRTRTVVKVPWDARKRRSCTSDYWQIAFLHLQVRNKKLSYRRWTARCVVSVEILPIATQQCRNYTCTTSPELSISCRQLTRATKSCCRQRLTISAINYSGRASELGGIIDLVDRRRPSLSRSERQPFSS